jgi:hypothetical protein
MTLLSHVTFNVFHKLHGQYLLSKTLLRLEILKNVSIFTQITCFKMQKTVINSS